jgi:hypothetical protein
VRSKNPKHQPLLGSALCNNITRAATYQIGRDRQPPFLQAPKKITPAVSALAEFIHEAKTLRITVPVRADDQQHILATIVQPRVEVDTISPNLEVALSPSHACYACTGVQQVRSRLRHASYSSHHVALNPALEPPELAPCRSKSSPHVPAESRALQAADGLHHPELSLYVVNSDTSARTSRRSTSVNGSGEKSRGIVKSITVILIMRHIHFSM